MRKISITIIVFICTVFFFSGCRERVQEKLEEEWGHGENMLSFKMENEEYLIDAGNLLINLTELIMTESWISQEKLYQSFQKWETDVEFYYNADGISEDETEIILFFDTPLLYQDSEYILAVYAYIDLQKENAGILYPDIEIVARKTDEYIDYEYMKESMDYYYIYIGTLYDFQFPAHFSEPDFTKKEKQVTDKLLICQEPDKYWPKELRYVEDSLYLQYWNGFSSYYRMVYQDEDNKRYYSVVLDETGNIKREKKMIGQDEYKNISKIGINVS